jgi:hypothetical protein
VSPPSYALVIGLLSALVACDQLGNPPQFATGPTTWDDEHGHIVTTTRSFRNEKTIRRLVSEGLGDLDHADPSIGPAQTLTLVSAVPRRLTPTRRRELELVTIFKFPDRAPLVRRWNARASSRHWGAAFATPEPPIGAVTSVAP